MSTTTPYKPFELPSSVFNTNPFIKRSISYDARYLTFLDVENIDFSKIYKGVSKKENDPPKFETIEYKGIFTYKTNGFDFSTQYKVFRIDDVIAFICSTMYTYILFKNIESYPLVFVYVKYIKEFPSNYRELLEVGNIENNNSDKILLSRQAMSTFDLKILVIVDEDAILGLMMVYPPGIDAIQRKIVYLSEKVYTNQSENRYKNNPFADYVKKKDLDRYKDFEVAYVQYEAVPWIFSFYTRNYDASNLIKKTDYLEKKGDFFFQDNKHFMLTANLGTNEEIKPYTRKQSELFYSKSFSLDNELFGEALKEYNVFMSEIKSQKLRSLSKMYKTRPIDFVNASLTA